MTKKKSILERWEISEEEFTELIDQNPSLRGMNLGYIAEKKFHDQFLNHPEITESSKDDDHDRSKKGDRRIRYKGHEFIVEVKSLQTNMCKDLGNDTWAGKSQVDGSDRRIVKFADGTELNTTLLLRGEFDLLAINCFAFGEEWRFAFAKNKDLPTSSYKKYTEEQRKQLIASLVPVTWPPQAPFTSDPFKILDDLIQEKAQPKPEVIGEEVIEVKTVDVVKAPKS
ncbi:restriction endonuclease [Paraburkholderia hayleyella]|uniref:restriction endonuclease n=1 Tax=Paraburkholderia hayleyella TaxID=2152889 RepID=UPI00129193B7|nr:restriction endonuclease [Paraburkholderia hayleyella]